MGVRGSLVSPVNCNSADKLRYVLGLRFTNVVSFDNFKVSIETNLNFSSDSIPKRPSGRFSHRRILRCNHPAAGLWYVVFDPLNLFQIC